MICNEIIFSILDLTTSHEYVSRLDCNLKTITYILFRFIDFPNSFLFIGINNGH